MPESSDLDHPEFRSHTSRKPVQLAAKYPTLYKKDQGVWLIGARSMKGVAPPLTLVFANYWSLFADSDRTIYDFQSQR